MGMLQSKVLVTGGAGFIGSHLVEKLVENGKQVIVLDDFSNGRMENLEDVKTKITIIRYDVSFPFSEMREALKDHRLEGIFHLACYPRSLSLENPFRDLEVNARGMLNILELAKLNKCKVVFTSNSGIYGEPIYLPIDERHPDNPTTPYDANKLAAEHYAKIYNRIYKVQIALCRLATVYGERQRTKPDWKPVVAEFAEKILKNEPPVIYWDGQQTRDLIYVKDVVQGLIKAFNSEDTKDEVFILGTGIETSINAIYEIVSNAIDRSLKPERAKKVAGDIRRMQYSYEKAKKVFGFQPEYTVRQGIQSYIKWLSQSTW